MPLPKSVQSKTKALQEPERKTLARSLLGRGLGFRDCAAPTLDALVEAGRMRAVSKGEQVAQRGAPFDALCLVVEGALESSMTRHDGHRHLIGYLQPGDLAGLISLFDGLGHVNDLTARCASHVLLIPGSAVRAWRESDPKLSRAMELQLAFRSRLLYERLASDSSLPLEQRLARLLHTLANLYGLPRDGALLLDMKLSQADLADWLGASRQRVNFVVQQLQQAGLIRVRYSAIAISDPEGLARMASH